MEYALSLNEDSSISNDRAERLALLVADGISEGKAWGVLGGKPSGRSYDYFRALRTNPVYIARVAALKQEREDLMTDTLFGEAKWMANQMWREARATGNATLMQKAAEMRMKILEKEEARIASTPQQGVIPQRPGKPVVENPQATSAAAALRERLMVAGAPTPGSEVSAPSTEVSPAPPEDVRAPAEEPPAMEVDFEAALARALPA